MNNDKLNNKANKTYAPIIHIFMFAIFPILSLFYNNIDLTRLSHIVFPIIISTISTIFVYFVIKATVKISHKAGLLTSLFLLLFYTFGFCIDFRIIGSLGSQKIYVYQVALTFWILLLIFPTFLIIKTKKNLVSLTEYLNISSLATVFFVIFMITGYFITHQDQINTARSASSDSNSNHYPDVYYIILDAYAREDILLDYYNYDNSDFINFLEKTGFYVAKKSLANYSTTYYSIPSSLNIKQITYLKDLLDEETSQDQSPLKNLIKYNYVHNKFKDMGYTLVDVPSIWTDTNQVPYDITTRKKLSLNEFDNALINTTLLGFIFKNKILLNSRRNEILNAFEYIPEIANIETSTFSYIHILSPHPPFLFDKNGNPLNVNSIVSFQDGCHYFQVNKNRNEYIAKYANQLSFINSKVEETIKNILSVSEQDPIIIIQSDHGPRSSCNVENEYGSDLLEQYSILNAYYLPDKGKEMLYDSITPVNSFRVVFNTLFDTKLELLEDKNYFVGKSRSYDFIDVTEKIHNNAQ